jgi:hypothetical protein
MTNKKFWLGILVMALVFGLVFAGCNFLNPDDEEENNQGNNQENNQGNNPGNNQGDNQGNNQGNNQGDNQGNNQGNNQGDNQGNNQGNNQGDNQGNNNNGGISKPDAPTGVIAVAQSSSSIKVGWELVPNAAGYYVHRSSSASGTYDRVGSSDSYTYLDTGLSASTTYFYKVSAYNSAGESSLSTNHFSATTNSSSGGGGTITKPSAPTGVTATAQSSSSIRIIWDPVSGAASYNVYYATSSSGTYYLDGPSNTTSFTSSGWDPSKTGYFKVTAVNSAGEEGPASSIVSATTLSSGGGGGGGASYGSVKIVNNSTRTIRNFTLYQQGYNIIGGTGFYFFGATIEAGSSATWTNAPPGNYVRIGSDTYQSYKVSKDTTFTVTAGQTTTVTITNSDLVSN